MWGKFKKKKKSKIGIKHISRNAGKLNHMDIWHVLSKRSTIFETSLFLSCSVVLSALAVDVRKCTSSCIFKVYIRIFTYIDIRSMHLKSPTSNPTWLQQYTRAFVEFMLFMQTTWFKDNCDDDFLKHNLGLTWAYHEYRSLGCTVPNLFMFVACNALPSKSYVDETSLEGNLSCGGALNAAVKQTHGAFLHRWEGARKWC